jgi:hypothetical protein
MKIQTGEKATSGEIRLRSALWPPSPRADCHSSVFVLNSPFGAKRRPS